MVFKATVVGFLVISAVYNECYAGSFASKLLNAADKTIQTVKNNPKYVQKLDEVVDVVTQAGKELYDTVSLVMTDEDKERILQEAKASAKVQIGRAHV